MTSRKRSDYFGTGFAFPFRFEKGGVKRTDDLGNGLTSPEGQKKHIAGAIEQILQTSIGERAFRRSFGSDLFQILFLPADDFLIELVKYNSSRAVRKWERRIVIEDVQYRLAAESGSAVRDTAHRLAPAGVRPAGSS